MAEQLRTALKPKRGLSFRDVNGFVLVLLALTATFTLTTLTEANYRAQDAERAAAAQAEDVMSIQTASTTGYICDREDRHEWAG